MFLMKKEVVGDLTQIHKQKDGNTTTDSRDYSKTTTSQGLQAAPEAGRRDEFSRASGRCISLYTPFQSGENDSGLLSSGTVKEYISASLSHPTCGNWLQQPQKLTKYHEERMQKD